MRDSNSQKKYPSPSRIFPSFSDRMLGEQYRASENMSLENDSGGADGKTSAEASEQTPY
jgi:hypothetical protein